MARIKVLLMLLGLSFLPLPLKHLRTRVVGFFRQTI